MRHPDCHCPRAEHHHGHRQTYRLHACRCEACRHAANAYNRRVRRASLYAQYNPSRALLVDAEPVRAHVQRLLALGWSVCAIAELAGINESTLAHLRFPYRQDGKMLPPVRNMRRPTAEAILAVPLARALQKRVNAVGTRRRIQALAHLGWGMPALARMLGVDKRELRTDRGAGRAVPVETARAVAQLYKRLVVTPPRLDGSGPSMRGRAIAKGWPPPWAWTERTIDDPGAGPLPYELRPVA